MKKRNTITWVLLLNFEVGGGGGGGPWVPFLNLRGSRIPPSHFEEVSRSGFPRSRFRRSGPTLPAFDNSVLKIKLNCDIENMLISNTCSFQKMLSTLTYVLICSLKLCS